MSKLDTLPMTNEVVLGDKWNWLWMILGIKAEEPLNTIPSQHPAKQSRTRLVFLNSSAIAAGSSLSLLKASDLPLLMTASEIFDSWAVSQPEKNVKLNLCTFILRTKLLGLVQRNPIYCCCLRIYLWRFWSTYQSGAPWSSACSSFVRL